MIGEKKPKLGDRVRFHDEFSVPREGKIVNVRAWEQAGQYAIQVPGMAGCYTRTLDQLGETDVTDTAAAR